MDINETVGFIEAEEMARDAIAQPAVNASVTSSYKPIKNNTMKKSKGKVNCNMCDTFNDTFVWNKRMNKFVKCSVCPSVCQRGGRYLAH